MGRRLQGFAQAVLDRSVKVALRILVLNTDYDEFLAWLYAQEPGLEKAPYAEQFRARMKSLFGVADFYSSNLRRLGHEAWDVHANNEFMQKAWASENGIQVAKPAVVARRWQKAGHLARHAVARPPFSYARRLARPFFHFVNGNGQPDWFYDILAAQIKQFRPDVLLNQDVALSSEFLREMKPYMRLLVGQHAATRLPDSKDWSCYDLAISSFLPTVEFFRQKGVRSELNRLGFEPKVLACLPSENRNLDFTFVGSFHRVHKSRTEFLETLCVRFPQLRIWGPESSSLSSSSAIRQCYAGQAWGRQMYQVLLRSKIVLNHHGDIAPYANNLRLFEATGTGALLLTDWKENLEEMFKPGEEVATYRTTEECIESMSYYLEHEEARASMAYAGQQRTLREHNYTRRMEEFVEIVRKYL